MSVTPCIWHYFLKLQYYMMVRLKQFPEISLIYSNDICTSVNAMIKQTQTYISWVHILFETLAFLTLGKLLIFSVPQFLY